MPLVVLDAQAHSNLGGTAVSENLAESFGFAKTKNWRYFDRLARLASQSASPHGIRAAATSWNPFSRNSFGFEMAIDLQNIRGGDCAF